jgi:hypothetical protein
VNDDEIDIEKLEAIVGGVMDLKPANQLRVAAGVLDKGKHPHVALAITIMVARRLESELDAQDAEGT